MEKTPKHRRRSSAHQNRFMERSQAKINRALLGTLGFSQDAKQYPTHSEGSSHEPCFADIVQGSQKMKLSIETHYSCVGVLKAAGTGIKMNSV